MAGQAGHRRIFSLLELGQSVQRMFEQHYNKRYWVKAEMNKLNHYGRTGHCHPDLVEKEGGQIIAEMRANLWKADYQRIDQEFKRLLGEPLKEGIKILFQCSIGYHPRYGLSLRIIDIDVEYTLGDLAREKQETIAQLTREQLFDKNKKLNMPLLPRRLAVISVETSNGYADFIKVLETNSYAYKFEHTLFPSLLQGDRAVGAMLRQLEAIRKRAHEFDLVAIIRGGGGDVGLSFLNKYELSHAVATFPIPVVTGIGHATNKTVVEMIAHTDAITPTEMADWLLQRYRSLELKLDQAADTLRVIPKEIIFGAREALDQDLKMLRSEVRREVAEVQHRLAISQQVLRTAIITKRITEQQQLSILQADMKRSASGQLTSGEAELNLITDKLSSAARLLIERAQASIAQVHNTVRHLSPENVLKRGYSITRVKGRVVSSVKDLKPGQTVVTELLDAVLETELKSIEAKKS